MHSFLILLSLVGAIAMRLAYRLTYKAVAKQLSPANSPANAPATRSHRWPLALCLFLLPPLLILAMAIAILTMGVQGSMLGHGVGHAGHAVALAILLWFSTVLAWQSLCAVRSQSRIRRLPRTHIQGVVARRLESPLPFAARVGFWQPVLVVSQGLQTLLNKAEVAAVLCHEQAHLTYRDTFWFFWLGWLRTATAGLPGTRLLWDELLLLREMRADAWAAQSHDPLLLAESLLKMAQAAVPTEPGWVMFSEGQEADCLEQPNRLEQRIEALLAPELGSHQSNSAVLWVVVSLAIAMLPLLTNLLHI